MKTNVAVVRICAAVCLLLAAVQARYLWQYFADGTNQTRNEYVAGALLVGCYGLVVWAPLLAYVFAHRSELPAVTRTLGIASPALLASATALALAIAWPA